MNSSKLMRVASNPLTLALLALIMAGRAVAADVVVADLEDVRIESERRIRGKDFEWDHGIRMALPASYSKSERSYPVLWVTDGPMYFELAVKAVHYDLRWHVPEMIVVAIGPPAAEIGELGARRTYEFSASPVRGFTGFGSSVLAQQQSAADEKRKTAGGTTPLRGGASRFLSFLADELRPVLARDYRMADEHVLFGDSGGGVFCTYVLLSRAEAFSKYICGSPNLYSGDHELFRLEERYAKAHRDLKATVFFGVGEAEMRDPNALVQSWGVVSATARMVEILSSRRYPSLKLHARIFAGEDHASVPPLNLSWGLRMVWQD